MQKICLASIILLALISCSPKKNETALSVNETQVAAEAENLSQTPETVNENKSASETKTFEEFQYHGKFYDLIRTLHNPFHYDFPEIIATNVRTENYDISHLTEEEQNFYHKYVGSYFKTERLTYDYLSRHIYQMNLSHIENGIKFYKLGRTNDGVIYDKDKNVFYEYESYSAMQIEDIANYDFDSRYTKIGEDDIFEQTIEKKRVASINLSKKEIDEKKLRQMFIGFFENLDKGNFDFIVNNYIDAESLKTIAWNGSIEKKTDEKYLDTFKWYKSLFSSNQKFDIYVNVYFSEDEKLISENFGNCILVEFKYPNVLNYFSFVVNEMGEEYKIVGYRDVFDTL